MSKFDYRTVESMSASIKRESMLRSGYKFRVIRWDSNEKCSDVAYYKTANGAKQRASRENVNA